MPNATTRLFVAGLLVVLPASAGNPKRGPDAKKAIPDLLVFVDNGNRVTPSVLFQAEATATRMFAGIGVQVQWTERRPGRRAELASTGCAPKRPEEIGIRMALERTSSASLDVFAAAHPYVNDGVRVTVFYGALREAVGHQPRLETAVLAHVLVHEITHVLQGVARHSDTGVMRAHWNASDYTDMEQRPLEFAGRDAELIHLGLAGTQSPACVGTASAFSVGK
jgi:hypothetical protein